MLVGLTPRLGRPWAELPPASSFGLVVGEERQGLSPTLGALCAAQVELPRSVRADSLNVGIAAGVMMYELVRRRLARAEAVTP